MYRHFNQISLRPHHLLCTEFFEGKGYSNKFVKNMYDVISILENNPEIKITINRDVICSKCPRDCNSGNAEAYDKRVLEYCNLHDGDIKKYNILKNKILSEILEKNLLSNVCGNCQWYEICGKSETDRI